ncbi:hypothetical protein FIBSPDRAFT_1039680 [Athelia psychrophila]|uniref:Nephrocystin 3-like N-terminal domain-containing protein n=1 Tax=Athelia psychrophila TaxID=1759441 RepID=A0A166RGS9_9AGAM|nr:hypothetical protein FIBSPDRAFT_1039680 [Fibularhizoctonia sp. CBS 109695]
MDNGRNWQETQNSTARRFLTAGTFRDVINTTGNVTMGDHVEHQMIMDNHRISLYPEYVVPDAGYQGSGPRARCLERTREEVIAVIQSWKNTINRIPICWLSGPAGFGKSAISQTIAETCARDGTLIASFFFLRGAGGRSEFARLITTISFQITVSIPGTKTIIEQALRNDPSIPHQSIANQLQKLVLEPLVSVPTAYSPTRPHIIVIDALDECIDKQAMQEFIGILASAVRAEALPLRWLLTSRREEHLKQGFLDGTARATSTWVSLEDFDASSDIETFLKHRFSEIRMQNPRLMHGIPLPWPSIEEMWELVWKATGMFVFASTLVDFITDGTAPPQQKLKSVLSLHAGLDPLYVQVLGAVPDMPYFRRVLTTLMIAREQPSTTELADLLRLKVEDVLHTLNFIQSIIHVPADDITPVQLNHSSLRDFLVDGSRSYGLFIDPPPAAHFILAADCLKLMNRTFQRDVFLDNAGSLYAIKYWVEHLQDSAAASEVFPELLHTLDDFVSSDVMEVWINWLILHGQMQNTQRLLAALIEKYQGGAGRMDVNIRVPLEEDHQKGAEVVSRFAVLAMSQPSKRITSGRTSHLAFSFAIERDVPSGSLGLGITQLHDLRGALYPQNGPLSSCTSRTCPVSLALGPHTPITAVGHKADLEGALPSELNVEDINMRFPAEGPPAVFIPSQLVDASLPIPQDHITHPTRVRHPELYVAGKPLYRGKKEHTEIASIEAMAKIIPIVFFCTLQAAYGLLVVLWLLTVLLPPINNMICLEKRTRGLNNGMYWRGGATGAKGRVIVDAIAVPLLQVIISIFVKRLMDLNKEGSAAAHSQRGLARYIDPIFLLHFNLKRRFDLLNTDY